MYSGLRNRTAWVLSIGPLSSLKIMGWEKTKRKYASHLFPKLSWGSYCRLCIHYCLPLVPLHQYGPGKIWCGSTFHWQSMSGWVDSVLIWDNSAGHVWLAPVGHIEISSTPNGCVNGLELHWGSGCFLSVCMSELKLFSTPEVPITDYQTKERKNEQGRETWFIANNAFLWLRLQQQHATGNTTWLFLSLLHAYSCSVFTETFT